MEPPKTHAWKMPGTEGWKRPSSMAGAPPSTRPEPEVQQEPFPPEPPEEIPEGYVNPDDIWGQGDPTLTFYYGDLGDGQVQLITTSGNLTHWHMLEDHWPEHNGREIRERAIANGLVGRIGEFCTQQKCHYWLSVWNNNRDMISKLMGRLIAELKSKRPQQYSESMIISTPFGNRPVQEYESIGTKSKYSPEEIASMQKRMHLAHGEEKKAIMKALGLYRTGRSPKAQKKLAWKHAAGLWPEHLLNFREWLNG